MTHLICSIMVEDVAALLSQVQQAWAHGATAIELRLDRYHASIEPIKKLLCHHNEKTWIITNRSIQEGGCNASSAADRVELLQEASKGSTTFIDIEHEDWNQQIADMLLNPSKGHRIILSKHDYDGCPDNVTGLLTHMKSTHHSAITKIAYTAQHINDSFVALDLMHEHGNQIMAIAMGDSGQWSRILASKLGAFGTFCYADGSQATAPGQLSAQAMIEHYRWHTLDTSTKVFGVVGDPVAHSMSPILFNHWFADERINAVYLPLHVTAGKDELKHFLHECTMRPWLHLTGLSITVPYKQAALAWVGENADRLAQSIGATNTLTFKDQGILAHNTDAHAALNSITDTLQCDHKDLAGVTVDILGAGGSARAVVAGLRSYACNINIYSRKNEASEKLAKDFDVEAAPWTQRGTRNARILINCTPVGMWPCIDVSPLPTTSLQHYELVFDLIYNPMKTKLLSDAQAQGLLALNGLDMFVRQAAAQFELWTGISPDTTVAHRLIEKKLSTENIDAT